MNAPVRVPDVRADPLAVFKLRCWARATLWQTCEFDLHEAVDALQRAARETGLVKAIGQDRVQKIMVDAFSKVRS